MRLASLPARAAALEGEPRILATDLAAVPVVGWREWHADGRPDWVTLDPIALVLVTSMGTRRLLLGDEAAYPSPLDLGGDGDWLADRVRESQIAAVFGPLAVIGSQSGLAVRHVAYRVDGEVESDMAAAVAAAVAAAFPDEAGAEAVGVESSPVTGPDLGPRIRREAVGQPAVGIVPLGFVGIRVYGRGMTSATRFGVLSDGWRGCPCPADHGPLRAAWRVATARGIPNPAARWYNRFRPPPMPNWHPLTR